MSEQRLKKFNEQNRQISSPSLQLQFDRLSREMEVQKGIFLTLKQQLELAKIEQIQGSPIIQILDKPQLPLSPSNQTILINIIISLFFGIFLGSVLGFFRFYFKNSYTEDKRKFRRVKGFFRKKTKEIALDKRVSGVLVIILFACSPLYLFEKSENPIFLNSYSPLLLLMNILYLSLLIACLILFIKADKK